MTQASHSYPRTALLVVIIAGAAMLIAGLGVLLWLVLESPQPEPELDEPAPSVAQPAAPAPAPAPDQSRPRRVTSRAAPPRRPPAPAPAPSPRRRGVIGVAECDDFLEKFAACAASQVQESRRKYLNGLLPVYRDQWIRDAKDPEGEEALAMSCNKAAAHFRITLAEANCDL